MSNPGEGTALAKARRRERRGTLEAIKQSRGQSPLRFSPIRTAPQLRVGANSPRRS